MMNLVHNLKVDSYVKIKSKIYTFKQKNITSIDYSSPNSKVDNDAKIKTKIIPLKQKQNSSHDYSSPNSKVDKDKIKTQIIPSKQKHNKSDNDSISQSKFFLLINKITPLIMIQVLIQNLTLIKKPIYFLLN